MIERQRFADLLRHCSKNSLLTTGRRLHGSLLRAGLGRDLMLNNDLIDMYSKCRRVDLSCHVFDGMPDRNVVSWTALMCGLLQSGDPLASLSCFSRMVGSLQPCLRPNEFTLSTALKASGVSGLLQSGKQVHGISIKLGLASVCVVGNCAIDMYSKCWRIDEAERAFGDMSYRNLISWNVMIAGYVLVEDGEKGLPMPQMIMRQVYPD